MPTCGSPVGEGATRRPALHLIGSAADAVRANGEARTAIAAGGEGKGWWQAADGVHVQLGRVAVGQAIALAVEESAR